MNPSKRRRDVPAEIIAHPGVASLPFEKALAAFVEAQDAVGHTKVTKKDYKTVVGIFLRYMTDVHCYTAVQQITEADLFGWLAHLRNSLSSWGRPYSSRTIATYSRDVRTFLRWLVVHNYLTLDPMSKIKELKVDKPLIRVFTQDELALLDAACDRAPRGKFLDCHI